MSCISLSLRGSSSFRTSFSSISFRESYGSSLHTTSSSLSLFCEKFASRT
ncbi:hypothetical protein HanXRQr2_Chr13g0606341 [Helianthus annuus]|uniref:Uncharacterized protein n=1 Tax=Helianthus annuus TaxID=4232 RepID=A0A9K3HDI8_HELAN|nr:hypothetical protein HanXRQr2_Chr13g0606341 [Helianthus annuus]KAJ0850758.1 hypothetical protein HanPSC8_Chr13g0584591 [Helianthus annuus]